MNCPFCSHDSTSVLHTNGNIRRRQCAKCYRRWTTREVMEDEAKALDRAKMILPQLAEAITGKAA